MTETPLVNENTPVSVGEDDLRQYLRDVGMYPMLSHEEEIALAKLCADGDAEAIRMLTASNLRLVVKIAREYSGRGVPLMDLIQEGSLGLFHAAKKFDYTKQCRFSTYATKWIRQSIDRCVLEHGSLIHIPRQKMEKIRKFLAIRAALLQELGEEPTPLQIAERSGDTPELVEEYLSMVPNIHSLNSPVGEDDDGSLQILIENLQAPQPHEEMVKQELNHAIDTALQELDERQRRVLRLRFGMEDGINHSFASVGEKICVSKERARQLEQQALDLLLKNSAGQGLEDFLE